MFPTCSRSISDTISRVWKANTLRSSSALPMKRRSSSQPDRCMAHSNWSCTDTSSSVRLKRFIRLKGLDSTHVFGPRIWRNVQYVSDEDKNSFYQGSVIVGTFFPWLVEQGLHALRQNTEEVIVRESSFAILKVAINLHEITVQVAVFGNLISETDDGRLG